MLLQLCVMYWGACLFEYIVSVNVCMHVSLVCIIRILSCIAIHEVERVAYSALHEGYTLDHASINNDALESYH